MRNQMKGFCATVLLLVFGSFGAAWCVFGSLDHAVAFIAGRGVVVRPVNLVLDVGSSDAQKVTGRFVACNLTGHPIRLLGAQTSCECISATSFPMEIEPWRSAPIDVDVYVSANRTNAPIYTLMFFTDVPGEHCLPGTLAIRFSDKPD